MRVLVILPTYNECENIETALNAIFNKCCGRGVSVLVVDDCSPDGTGGIVQRIIENEREHEGRLFLLSRDRKHGLAGAYIAGFRWGLERGFDLLVQMDADLSHDPAFLPAIVEAAEQFDFVVGSRYIPGGAVEHWSPVRRVVSKAGSLFARIVLRSPIHDLTGGFNAWNRRVFQRVGLSEIISEGYCFQIEVKYRAMREQFSWTEIPITFKDRVSGRSKMTARIALEAVKTVLLLGWRPTNG